MLGAPAIGRFPGAGNIICVFAFRGTGSEDFRRWMIAVLSGPPKANWRRSISTVSELLIGHPFFGGRGRFLMPSEAFSC
jgi:hypothetical protein